MTITATFESIEEIKAFAGLFGGQADVPAPAKTAAPTQTVVSAATAPTQTVVSAATAPAQSVAPAATAPAPAAPVQSPALAAVPTSTPKYELNDLAVAAMTLMDSGRQADLQGLLARFGVEALPMLPPAQYGAFATALREMGAQI